MKQLIISVALIISALATFAQHDILNGTFESHVIEHDTVNMTSDTNATGWSMSFFGAGITDDAYTGNSAAYIWNWYYYAHGELTNGLGNFPDEGGTPATFLPTQMTGFYKYIIGDVQTANDSALAVVCLTKYNSTTSQRDTVGIGIKKLGEVATYTAFKVDINYLNGQTPDTVTVKFVSSENGFCSNASAGNCLFFYVDDVEVSDASTGISEEMVFEQLSVYPNPANDVVNITAKGGKEISVQLFNAIGEEEWSGNIVAGKTESVNISHLPSGMYFVKEQLANGKSFKLLKQ
jgi:hypothetical protein